MITRSSDLGKTKQTLQRSTHQQPYQILMKESHPKFSMYSNELLGGFICRHKYAAPVGCMAPLLAAIDDTCSFAKLLLSIGK